MLHDRNFKNLWPLKNANLLKGKVYHVFWCFLHLSKDQTKRTARGTFVLYSCVRSYPKLSDLKPQTLSHSYVHQESGLVLTRFSGRSFSRTLVRLWWHSVSFGGSIEREICFQVDSCDWLTWLIPYGMGLSKGLFDNVVPGFTQGQLS